MNLVARHCILSNIKISLTRLGCHKGQKYNKVDLLACIDVIFFNVCRIKPILAVATNKPKLSWGKKWGKFIGGYSFKRLQLGFWRFIPHETYTGHRTEVGKDDEKHYFGIRLG